MRPWKPILAGAVLAVCMSGGAVSQDEEGAAAAEARRCLLVSQIDTYHPIDRNHVVIVGEGERIFLLGTMRPGCWDLASSHAIALESGPITLCEGYTATLRVRGGRCHIRTLEAVESVEAAESLAYRRNQTTGGSRR